MAPKGKPSPAKAQEEAVEIQVGDFVRFLGYGPDVPEAEQLLVKDEEYEVVSIPEGEDDEETFIVRYANPNFNKKKKVSEENEEFVETEVFGEEIELVEEENDEVIEGEVVDAEEAEEAPAPVKTSKAKATAAKSTKVESPKAAAAKTAPTKGKAASAKAEPKATTTKGAAAKGKAATPAKPEAKVDADSVPDLEIEDAEVLALIDGQDLDGLIGQAQGIESDNASNEFRLGGLLYHIKKEGSWKERDERYQGTGGWPLFVEEHFNLIYRKAQYLVEIYIAFSQAGITNGVEVVASIGWTKAQKISKPLLEGADADTLIELAESNTVKDLSEVITSTYTEKKEGAEKGERKKRATVKFSYEEEDAQIISTTLSQASEQLGIKESEALLQIVGEWATLNLGSAKAKGKGKSKVAAVEESEEEEEAEEEVAPTPAKRGAAKTTATKATGKTGVKRATAAK